MAKKRKLYRESKVKKKEGNPWPVLLAVGSVAIVLILLILAKPWGKRESAYQPPDLSKVEVQREGFLSGEAGKTGAEKEGSKPEISGPVKSASLFFDAIRTKNRRNLEKYFDYPRYRKTLREARGEKDDWTSLSLLQQVQEKDAFFLPLLQDENVLPLLEGILTLSEENTDYDTSVLKYRLKERKSGAEKEVVVSLYRKRDLWVACSIQEHVIAEKKASGEENLMGLSKLESPEKETDEEKEFLKIAAGEGEKELRIPKHYFEGIVSKVPLLQETTGESKRSIQLLIQKTIDPKLTREALNARLELKKFGKEAIPFLLNGLVDLDMAREKDVQTAHQIIQSLRIITNQNFGFSPQMGKEDTLTAGSLMDRESAVRSWFGWWQLNKDTFFPDLKGLEEEGKKKRRGEEF